MEYVWWPSIKCTILDWSWENRYALMISVYVMVLRAYSSALRTQFCKRKKERKKQHISAKLHQQNIAGLTYCIIKKSIRPGRSFSASLLPEMMVDQAKHFKQFGSGSDSLEFHLGRLDIWSTFLRCHCYIHQMKELHTWLHTHMRVRWFETEPVSLISALNFIFSCDPSTLITQEQTERTQMSASSEAEISKWQQ